MTNYANWWAYYRTRMQSMKTATSLSFQPIGSSYRVGYMTINNNTTTDFQNIDTFSADQKKAWYDKIFAAVPRTRTRPCASPCRTPAASTPAA
jgi:type IV pilus assembly protein PilY1